MVKNIKKTSNRVVAIAWAMMWLVHPALAGTGSELSPDSRAGTVMLIVFFSMSCLLAWTVLNNRRTTSLVKVKSEDAAFQIDALNRHSIVTITDKHSNIIDVNDRQLALFGYERSELIGKPASILYPESDFSVYANVRSTLARGEIFTGETRLISKTGQIIWTQSTIVPMFDDEGEHIKSISIRTDITKTKIANAEREMRTALHLVRDEIYMFDMETLKFTYLNQMAMEQNGWDEAEYATKDPGDVNPEFDVATFRALSQPLIDAEVDQVRYSLVNKGTPYDVSLQLIQPDGARPRFVAISRDASERVALEKTKDEFIATVSHELRSPLTSIKGSLGLILAGTTGDFSDRTRGMLEIARRNADRLILIINDILDLEKIAAGQMKFVLEPTDLTELIREGIDANEPYGGRFGVSFKGEGLEAPVIVNCDMDRIFQVLTNLMTNAAKFSQAGSHVTVALEKTDETARISVIDTGAGIPPDAQARIFDRFAQVDSSDRRAKGGTGLGLSIVKAIVERHGGKIELESEVGVGSTFRVDLPIMAGRNSEGEKGHTVAA